MKGYLHPGYAGSLAEFGTPLELPRCGGWILKRRIPGFPYCDGMGCYPLFVCRDWSQLHSDLESLRDELVSLALVVDPFGDYDLTCLHRCFDVVIPFKKHFIVDLSCDMGTFISSHHRRYARKALQGISIEKCQNPTQLIGEWVNLYTTLIVRHRIKGIPVFSTSSFTKQLEIPGIVLFRAMHQEITVGMILWYLQGDIGYYHLGAYSDIGYRLRASFALFWYGIEYFSVNGLRWLDLGAGAGINGSGIDGLSRFKRGWSTGTRSAYFCGRIFDQKRYSEIVEAKDIPPTDYFPAYRKGEFGRLLIEQVS